MQTLPTGTITFLFTDIEGSTTLWEKHPEEMRLALARHDDLLLGAVSAGQGYVVKTMGDGMMAAFHTATDAMHAALLAQQALQAEAWPEPVSIKVRMGLHTGAADLRNGDYFGPTLNRAARLMAAGRGGQVLLSDVTQDLCCDTLPSGASLLNLGVHRLKDLARPETIYQVAYRGLQNEFPPLRTLDNPDFPNNLPQQMTSFIGREKEITELRGLLEKSRLLTLTGLGGSGKTRLALQVAADVLDEYPDGVWLVEFASLTDSSLVAQTVAAAFGVPEQAGQTLEQSLAENMKRKRLLLVMDNCEHLVAACSKLADFLLRNCPQIKFLATSREPLGVSGELSYRVPSLSLPDPKLIANSTAESLDQYEGVRLFIDRAAFAKPGFAVTNASAPALAQLCYRLDGIPLALELAAARVRSLSVEEINDRLDNRFRLLTNSNRMVLPRQQTLRALIDWSYDLLSEQEKLLLSRLSVFSGGWTLSAAESVCGFTLLEDWQVLELMTSLVDKSLVHADETGEMIGVTRYRMLETVRQYCEEKNQANDEIQEVQGRHVDWCLAFVEDTASNLQGPQQAAWLERWEADHDNFRSALDCSLTDGMTTHLQNAMRLASGLWRFWEVRGHFTEGRNRLESVLSKWDGGSASVHAADALRGSGVLASHQSEHDAAQKFYHESLATYQKVGNYRGIAASLDGLGDVEFSQGNIDDALALFEQSLVIERREGNKAGIALSLNQLGFIAKHKGDYDTARALHMEAHIMHQELGSPRNIAASLYALGDVAYSQGDYDVARPLFEESIAINHTLHNRFAIAITLGALGRLEFNQANFEQAHQMLVQQLALQRDLGRKGGVASALGDLANVAFEQSKYDESRTLNAESLALYRELGQKAGVAQTLFNLGSVAFEQRDFSEARKLYEESLVLSKALNKKRLIAVVLYNIGNVWFEETNYAEAGSLYVASLALYRELEEKHGIAFSLEGVAALSSVQARPEAATILWGAADALRQRMRFPLPLNERPKYQERVSAVREKLDTEAFTAAWNRGQALSWEQAVDFALSQIGSEATNAESASLSSIPLT